MKEAALFALASVSEELLEAEVCVTSNTFKW